MIYHLNFSYYEKKSKFQVKFHVFCKFEKKSLVYTNFSGPGWAKKVFSRFVIAIALLAIDRIKCNFYPPARPW